MSFFLHAGEGQRECQSLLRSAFDQPIDLFGDSG
jgi:hypothetical protein